MYMAPIDCDDSLEPIPFPVEAMSVSRQREIIAQHAGPYPKKPALRILSWNANSIVSQMDRIREEVQQFKPGVIFIQETHLLNTASLPVLEDFYEFSVATTTRDTKRGLATYIYHRAGRWRDIRPIDDEPNYYQLLLVGSYLLVNVHFPTDPTSRTSVIERMIKKITSLSRHCEIIMGGDFNMHPTDPFFDRMKSLFKISPLNMTHITHQYDNGSIGTMIDNVCVPIASASVSTLTTEQVPGRDHFMLKATLPGEWFFDRTSTYTPGPSTTLSALAIVPGAVRLASWNLSNFQAYESHGNERAARPLTTLDDLYYVPMTLVNFSANDCEYVMQGIFTDMFTTPIDSTRRKPRPNPVSLHPERKKQILRLQPWVTVEILEQTRNVQALKNLYPNPTEEQMILIHQAEAEKEVMLRQSKHESRMKFNKELEERMRHHPKDGWNECIQSYMDGYSAWEVGQSSSTSDPSPELLMEVKRTIQESVEEITSHFSCTPTTPGYKNIGMRNFEGVQIVPNPHPEYFFPITFSNEEVVEYIKRLPNGKSPGLDGLTNEHLKLID